MAGRIEEEANNKDGYWYKKTRIAFNKRGEKEKEEEEKTRRIRSKYKMEQSFHSSFIPHQNARTDASSTWQYGILYSYLIQYQTTVLLIVCVAIIISITNTFTFIFTDITI